MSETEEEKPKRKKGERGKYFAIDADTWKRICDFAENTSINLPVAYLVLAQGSQADQMSTAWSAKAVHNYTGISRERASKAIKQLIESNFISQEKGGTRPSYKLSDVFTGKKKDDPDPIWLPNSIVTGVGKEIPPLVKLRQAQDIGALRLFIDLYKAQNLTGDGGISRSVVFRKYERTLIGTREEYAIYRFTALHLEAWKMDITKHHIKADNWTELWKRFELLTDCGLLEWHPYICESGHRDSELVHPCGAPSGKKDGLEFQAGAMAHLAAVAICNQMARDGHYTSSVLDSQPATHDSFLVPVRKSLINAQAIGIGRLKYRPKTAKTAEWYGSTVRTAEYYVEQFKAMASRWDPGLMVSNG